jgi:hypothetical protein
VWLATNKRKDGSVAMSNNFEDWDDDEELVEEKPQGTDLVKKLRQADRAKEKRIKELETELTGLRSVQREATIKSVLESKGVSPKVAKFIPQDVEISAEAIDSWIEENADIFGLAKAQQQQAEPDLATLRQIDALTTNAQSPAGIDDLLMRIQNAQSSEEINNMIFQAGGEF